MNELTVLMACTAGLAAALLLGFAAKRVCRSPIVGISSRASRWGRSPPGTSPITTWPIGSPRSAARPANDALPMRDAFAVLFFVSVGMLVDPSSLLHSPLLVALVLGVGLLGKPLAAILVVRVLGRPMATAVAVGAALAQVGEPWPAGRRAAWASSRRGPARSRPSIRGAASSSATDRSGGRCCESCPDTAPT